MIQLLAYQYRDLHDEEWGQSDDCKKFLAFLEKLGLPKCRILDDDSKKVMKFSYPDLYYHTPASDLKEPLVKQFDGKFQGVTLKDIYVVYVKQNAPHIGFTASVVFAMEMDDPSDDSLRKIFVPDGTSPSRFHQDFEGAWKEPAGKRETLPVVLFLGNTRGSSFQDGRTAASERLFGSAVDVTLPSGRSVRLQRGFPYVSYVIHADVNSVTPEDIHRCDFAMLMALPGFVEQKLQSVRGYRNKLVGVQKKLESNEFAAAEKEYNEAWKDFEMVQGLAPTTTAAVQRILQKYPGDSVFALIGKDNSQLIEFTVTAAIAATDQVRSNIQSFAQQKLTRSIRRASFWTALATIVLAVVSGITVWIAFRDSRSTRSQVTGSPQEPAHVIAEPGPLATPGKPAFLKILSELDTSQYKPRKAFVLDSVKNVSEFIGEVPILMAIPGVSPIEIAIVHADGTVIARNSLIAEKAVVAIRFSVSKDLFVEGQQYYVQASQSSVWTMKLPIKIAPH